MRTGGSSGIELKNQRVDASGTKRLRHTLQRDSPEGDSMLIKRLIAPVVILACVGVAGWGIYKSGCAIARAGTAACGAN